MLTVYVFLYGRLYLVLSGLEEGLNTQAAIRDNKPLQVALASQSFVQIGFLMALPMLMEIGLEKGFRTALSEFILMQLQLAPVFFTFSLGTKPTILDGHYFMVVLNIDLQVVGLWCSMPSLPTTIGSTPAATLLRVLSS